MALRHRPMQPKDVRPCAEVVAAHPVVGSRYGRTITDLYVAWLRLLGCEAAKAIVFEDFQGSRRSIWGVGFSVCLSDDFLRELKTPPYFWIGPELAKRIARGKSPVLSDRQVREMNSSGGLNLVVWEGCIRPEYMRQSEAGSRMLAAFLEAHRGYLWKEAIAAQASSVEHLQALLNSGGRLLSPEDGCYREPAGEHAQDLVARPHVIGLTRDLAREQQGSWIGTLFLYQAPKFGFNRSEQRLLMAALAAGTDKDLSDTLSISLPTVKKTWLAIYHRVGAQQPELIPARSQAAEWISARGKEKRHHLLGYLREHPEELRPVSRRILRQAQARDL